MQCHLVDTRYGTIRIISRLSLATNGHEILSWEGLVLLDSVIGRMDTHGTRTRGLATLCVL